MSSFSDEIAELGRLGLAGCGAGVGHLDTGVDPHHEFLIGSSVSTVEFGYRYGELRGPADAVGASHGTRMASVLVGAPPVGVAPAARLHSGAVIEAGNAIVRIVAGLDWLADQDIAVACLSLGVFSESPVFDSLIRTLAERDVLVVASSGNQGPGRLSTPGSSPACLTVGASDDDGRATWFSGSSATWADRSVLKPEVLAPGDGDRAGTSRSCALVAGLAALLRAHFPQASAFDVRSAIQHSAAEPHADQTSRSAMGVVQPMAAYARLARTFGAADSGQVGLGSSSRSRSCEAGFVDPRLTAQLGEEPGGPKRCDALFEFRSVSERTSFEQRIAAGGGDVRLRCRNVPIVAGNFATSLIRELLASGELCVASSLDIDPLAQMAT